MQFFCTKNHYTKWLEAHPDKGDKGFLLDIRQAVEAARKIFEVREAASPLD